MKPSLFTYRRAASVADAIALLAVAPDETSALAGGQSLGPLLNLRMTTAATLIDLAAIPELRESRDLGDAVFIGAGVTHAEIEDGKVPDPTHGFMRRAAAKIAYRAIRCHGTIGGSVAMADPAADWPCILLALGATARIAGPQGERRLAMHDLLVAAYETNLAPGEIILGFEIPKLDATTHVASSKINRKTGAFADSLAVAVRQGARSRVTLGAAAARACILPQTSAALAQGESLDALRPLVASDVAALLSAPDPYLQNLHTTNVLRTLAEALGA
jgi:carbon-monoxide dehydrogenase medium subunit